MYNSDSIDMANQSFLKTITYVITICFSIGIIPCLFASESISHNYTYGNRGYIQFKNVPEAKKGTAILKPSSTAHVRYKELLSTLQKQARAYRIQGLDFQRKGSLEFAIRSYKRAIELDPAYVVAYNDLGIVYEAIGSIKEAEEYYLKAIEIDPDFLSAYSNLALLYENTKDYNKALFYWQKRAQLSTANDTWTQRARQRAEDIKIIQGLAGPEKPSENDVLGLVKDTLKQKSILREDKREFAKTLFQKAKLSYERNDKLSAFQKASDAQLLDPSSQEIEDFVDQVRKELLAK